MPDGAEAVRAMRSPLAVWFMGHYFRRFARRHFDAVRLARDGRPRRLGPGPVIVYSNHPSWWDPVLFTLLGRMFFRDLASFGPMEETALRRYGVLRRIGVFGLDTGSAAGARQFFRSADLLLKSPGAALWITAEGHFADPRLRPIQLAPGVAHLARRDGPGTILPLALDYVFWEERAPEALIRFGAPIAFDPARSVAEWQAVLTERLTETMDRLGEASASRDPARFDCLIAGRTGIGGVYDLWRRARSAWHGQPAHLRHSDRG